MPTPADLPEPHDLTAQLKATQADLWRERTLRRLPHLAPAISLVCGDTEEDYTARADELDAALAAVRAQSKH